MADSYLRLKRHLNGVSDIVANLERDYLEMVAHADEMMRQRDVAREQRDVAWEQRDTLQRVVHEMRQDLMNAHDDIAALRGA